MKQRNVSKGISLINRYPHLIKRKMHEKKQQKKLDFWIVVMLRKTSNATTLSSLDFILDHRKNTKAQMCFDEGGM